jgi:hypothetical protein
MLITGWWDQFIPCPDFQVTPDLTVVTPTKDVCLIVIRCLRISYSSDWRQLFCVTVFMAIDRNSHSVSDTLYGIFPYFVSACTLLFWVASNTSKPI